MYYKSRIFINMNFKARGFTVGDLLLLIIILSLAFLSITKIKNTKENKAFIFNDHQQSLTF